jgi:hypothetical protein
VRRLALIASLVAVAALLAACGGGSSSSSGSSSTTPAEASPHGPGAAWTKEVEGVMDAFENHVSAQATETINTTYRQPLLEPLYRAYAIQLSKLADELEATKAPPSCAAVQKKIVDDGRAISQLTNQLGHRSEMNEAEYAPFAQVQRTKITRYGQDLTKLAFDPGC